MAPAADLKVKSKPAQDPQKAADPYRYSNKTRHRFGSLPSNGTEATPGKAALFKT